jgi:hypothetical protein
VAKSMGYGFVTAIVAILTLPGAAFAQQAMAPMQACTAPGVLPPAYAAWATPAQRDAAADLAGLAAVSVPVGQAVHLTLRQTPAVTYPLRPEKPGGSVSYGGLLRVVVAQHGTYRVALGSPAWIDLVAANGAAVDSVAHGRGPECTGIHKMVDFVLDPGAYTLQVSANGAPDVQVMVIPQP